MTLIHGGSIGLGVNAMAEDLGLKIGLNLNPRLRDTTEGRCLEEVYGKYTLDDCMFFCVAMIETGNECQFSAQLSMLSNDAIVVGCTEVLFQPSVSL